MRAFLIGISLFSLLITSSPRAHATEEWKEGMVVLACGAGVFATGVAVSDRLATLDTAVLLSTGMVGMCAGCVKLCKAILGNGEDAHPEQNEESDSEEKCCRVIPLDSSVTE